MLSSRLYLLFYYYNELMRHLGAAPLRFDTKRLLFQYDNSFSKRLTIGYICGILWGAGLFSLTIKYYMEGNVNGYNLTIPFLVAEMYAMTVYSIFYWDRLLREWIRAMNGLLMFLRYIRSKKIQFFKLTGFVSKCD